MKFVKPHRENDGPSVLDSTVRSLESEAKGQLHPKSAEPSVRVGTLDGRSRRAQRGNARPSGTSSTRGAVLTAQQSRLLALVRFINIVRSMNSAQLGHPS